MVVISINWFSAHFPALVDATSLDAYSGVLFTLLVLCAGFAVVRSGKRPPEKKSKSTDKNNAPEPDSVVNDVGLRHQRIQEAIANHFPDGLVCVLDRKMKFEFLGGTELQAPGRQGKHWLGKTITEDFHPSISHKAITEIREALEGKDVSYEVAAGNNAYRVNAIPIAGSNDDISEVLVIVRNVTGTIKLENNLKKAQQKEKEFNVLRSRFVTLASHEFRTPLSTILTSAFLLENYTGKDYETEKKSYLDKIKRAVHNLTGLLNDFLSIGKLEEGKLKVVLSEVELRPFLEGVLQEVISIKKARQDILLKFDADESTIITDRQLLKNIIMNLLTNAIKYSSSDEEIELFVEFKGGIAKFRVTDKGTGIPESEQGQIFKRFFRGQNANNIEGTGLGLNLVKKYVRLLKGSIDFTSKLHEGSTFTVRIPTSKSIENQDG